MAPCLSRVSVLKANTLGRSSSKSTASRGQSSRHARASSPDARITAWRIPDVLASSKKSSKNLVRHAT
ncbi:Uncharacterised protein [Mycobacteroides abscessus subsp. abscessus]|nr:Uncharacterised protein [Mycobacteroides abscessus subsp. abscessus]SKV19170.1 Uncharacterised protein [Mycobacteroides abscessus subsp. abscessus]